MQAKKPVRLIIAGGRNIAIDGAALAYLIDEEIYRKGFIVAQVVSGACPTGIDAAGEHWARAFGVPVKRFPADWKAHGRAAGPIRNAQMADYADMLVLVWDGASAGSKSMRAEMTKRGKPIVETFVGVRPAHA